MRLRAVDAVFQLANGAENARSIGAHAAILTNQPKLHRVPVQAREHFTGAQLGGLQPALAVGLNEVGHDGVEQQGHMTEQVVKDIGLDDVFKLFGLANPVRDGEFALGQQREEGHLGDQPRHTHNLPARGLEQAIVDLFKARNALFGTQRWQGVNEMLAGAARQQCGLPLVQAVISVVLGLGIGGVVLRAGVVGMRARVVAARWAVGLAIDNRGLSHHVLLFVEVWLNHRPQATT